MIHPSAVISKEAIIGQNVTIGPFSVIIGKVRIGDDTIIENHVTIGSETSVVEIGKNNRFFQGSVIGAPPQDLSYKGEPTKLEIGDNNNIREFCTLNCGTVKGGGVTKIGNNNLLMAYVHVAHDCIIGNHVVVANLGQFAGHVVVEDRVVIGGAAMFSQFLRIGKYSYIAGDTKANKDIMPFTIAEGKWAVMRATNRIGLERAGFKKEEIENINRVVRFVTKGHRTIEEALQKISEECEPSDHVQYMVDFIKNSEKGLAR